MGKIGTLLGTAGVNIQAAQFREDAEAHDDSARLGPRRTHDVRTAIAAAGGRLQARGCRSVVSPSTPMKLAIIAGDAGSPG